MLHDGPPRHAEEGLNPGHGLAGGEEPASGCAWVRQSPALIPFGTDNVSSCSNMVVANLENPKDRDAMIAALARSKKGFVDEPWRRFPALTRAPEGNAAELGYSNMRDPPPSHTSVWCLPAVEVHPTDLPRIVVHRSVVDAQDDVFNLETGIL